MQGHLPNAINIPHQELKDRIREIPIDQKVIAYCRGTYCVTAYETVAKLRAKGFKVRRLEAGFPEWKYEGFPVEIHESSTG
ncbi:rhodanese-like domain-containing protein [Deltaproteobacteria bacterium TL4]